MNSTFRGWRIERRPYSTREVNHCDRYTLGKCIDSENRYRRRTSSRESELNVWFPVDRRRFYGEDPAAMRYFLELRFHPGYQTKLRCEISIETTNFRPLRA